MSRAPRSKRRGIAVVFALVCLVVVSVLLGVVTRTALVQRQAAHNEGRRTQAAWLAESALDRAAARLAADPDYSGETWTIGADAFGGRHGAVVLIEVVGPDDDPQQRLVRVRADFPDDPVMRVRKSKQRMAKVGPGESSPADAEENTPET
ncbi:MAG: hypothetical protein JW888_01380 [Pirellulales bacterium]|nr:hypothetical protein [Pirellulales bacterium]